MLSDDMPRAAPAWCATALLSRLPSRSPSAPPISAISACLPAALRRRDPACMRKWPRLRDLWRHRSGAIVWRQLAVRSKSRPALIASFAGPHCLRYSEYMTPTTRRTGVPAIRFEATLDTIDTLTIMRLPEKASEKLPSRGQVAVQGTINGHEFQTVLEPDGRSGHWMRVDEKLQQTAGISEGGTATLEIESTKDWPEPSVPQDFETALEAAPQKIQDLWNDITPMARWEWVRWVNSTKNPDTRRRRVEVSMSKMNSGKRRPCCFNLAACTDPDLSKNGRLTE
jgi:Domain of unknown function (DUF1905)/Bacteriocin-protection, YdeI or OmpD-Associated